MKLKSVAPASIALCMAALFVALGPAPALAQKIDTDPTDAYQAGVDLGRTLYDARQCTGSGEYRQGCADGVEESQFDRQADQALGSDASDQKPQQPAPLFSPPDGMFQDPFSKPSDDGPPNDQ
ncbi:MAG TPA: hypothetical protein VMF67_07125 [Rhizomicrobium sp.]|nr:hypothetical protein [Rhizomicrobium sp.]